MQTDTKDNINPGEPPPVPPTPHFDLERIEAAKPVEPLGWRKRSVRRIFRRKIVIATVVVVGYMIVAGFAASFIDMHFDQQVASEKTPAAEGSLTESTPALPPSSVESSRTEIPRRARKHHPGNQVEPARQTIEIPERPGSEKPRARLVTVIH